MSGEGCSDSLSIYSSVINPFQANVLFLHPQKTTENKISVVFSGYRNERLGRHGSMLCFLHVFVID